MIGKHLYRVKLGGRDIRVCASIDDLPATSRRADLDVRASIPGRNGRVWVKYFRCEGNIYAVPYNGLEARNL